jgi:ABC-type uncharacterized transport system substrate-binding protein
MKNKILTALISIFIVVFVGFLVYTNLERPRILVLQSYYTDYSWVTDINKGILRILGGKPYSIRYFYMDTKRKPSLDYKIKTGQSARRMIDDWKPDVIIAVDDDAQQHVAIHYLNKPNINIVFTGVNATLKEYNYDTSKNTTGVLERIPFQEFREVFSSILPQDKNKIIHISDASTTSKYIHDELELVNWGRLKLIKSIQCETFDEWKNAIEIANNTADIILVTHYHTIKDNNGQVIKPKQIIEWTEPRLKIPDIGCWGFFVEDGGMMAVAVSPFEQGELAAKMTVKIVDGKVAPTSIPVLTSNQYIVYIREKSVKKRNFVMPKMLEAFAKATNNYYE